MCEIALFHNEISSVQVLSVPIQVPNFQDLVSHYVIFLHPILNVIFYIQSKDLGRYLHNIELKFFKCKNILVFNLIFVKQKTHKNN